MANAYAEQAERMRQAIGGPQVMDRQAARTVFARHFLPIAALSHNADHRNMRCRPVASVQGIPSPHIAECTSPDSAGRPL